MIRSRSGFSWLRERLFRRNFGGSGGGKSGNRQLGGPIDRDFSPLIPDLIGNGLESPPSVDVAPPSIFLLGTRTAFEDGKFYLAHRRHIDADHAGLGRGGAPNRGNTGEGQERSIVKWPAQQKSGPGRLTADGGVHVHVFGRRCHLLRRAVGEQLGEN